MDIAAPRASLQRRTFQGLVSQGLSSISNFALVVVVARTTAPAEFGAFAIAYSLTLTLVAATRSSIGDTLVVTATDHRSRQAATGAALIAGVWFGAIVLIVGVLWPHQFLGRWLLLFGLVLPVLAVQDGMRNAAFATHRPAVAALNDAIRLAVQITGWLVLVAAGLQSSESLLVVWAAGAGFGALAVGRVVGWPSLRNATNWVLQHRRTAATFGIDGFLSMGAPQVAVYAVAIAVGLPAAGALRGAESIYGPVRTFIAGISSVALPEASARARLTPNVLRRYAASVSSLMAALALTATAVFSLVPDALGRKILGDTWPAAAEVMPAVGLALTFGCFIAGARLGLRAHEAAPELLRLRAFSTVTLTGLGVVGAMTGGLVAAAVGLAIAQALTAALAWVFLHRLLRSMEAG